MNALESPQRPLGPLSHPRPYAPLPIGRGGRGAFNGSDKMKKIRFLEFDMINLLTGNDQVRGYFNRRHTPTCTTLKQHG